MQETAEQYRQRMFVLVDGKDPVKLQAAAPARLAKLLKGVSAARGRKRPAPGKWSIAEIVVHMADTEVVFGYLIRSIVGEPGARIDGFDQDAWLAALHYDKRDMKKSLAEYRAFREANVALLKSLTPEQWKICGMHKERGPETMATVVKMFAGHDLNHFQQIERILASRSKQ
jgi:DinB superfamily